jgi:hypothetical protein
VGSTAAETALAKLEREFARAERHLDCMRAAITDVSDAVRLPPPRVMPQVGRPHAAEALLFPPAVSAERTVRNLICDALRANDRPGGLGPLAISGVIHIDKQHINVELCHMAKQGRVVRVAHGMYRVVEVVAVEQEAQRA